MSGSKQVLIGKIQGTHGIKGQLSVIPFAGDASSISKLENILVKAPNGALESFPVLSVRGSAKKIILGLKPFDNINQVLHLVGRELYAEREMLPELEPDEYYWTDLIGLQVVTETGEALGELVEIIETGSNDVYVVQREGREVLIPALEDVVVSVDLGNNLMTVALPEGLLEP
ncbi:16S rRNA processing protein RimM [Geomonas sp. Red875]|uniref:Ribosome maturation factor RimM n=2 Tax=Geomesophilobacter sediminis TaxID=2798584 RepID=A0A8J7S7H9_9BACT|nr:ribosome maturation factor RimM [Geomesophilobacter sediminis]MBJ6727046.1 16S rRNA processing protein RimM [Geomesophilobacter sediminis]